MRRHLLAFVVLFLGLAFFASNAFAADKFGYVELGRIFSEYEKTKAYDQDLGNKENAYTAEREKKVSEVKQFQEKMNLLNDKEKEQKTKELELKVKTLQDFDRQKQTDLRKESNEKRAEVMKDIDAAIKQYAAKEGFTLIFNEVGVVYNAKSLDVTDQIVEALNKGYKK